MVEEELSYEAAKQLFLFKKCLPVQIKLHEIERSLGNTAGEMCLEIGSNNGTLCYHIRKHGGEWHSVVIDEAASSNVKSVVEENVQVYQGGALPFENKIFDTIVIHDFLERVSDDNGFIEDCHRIMKEDGRLIINTARVKHGFLIGVVRKLFGVTARKTGMVRPGYSEHDLFRILKHGFNVLNVYSYSRFFVELTDVITRSAVDRLQKSDEGDYEDRLRKIYSVASVFYWLGSQLDMLMFFSRGHYLIAIAQRRTWRARKAPVLIDGRSISTAVLTPQ